MIRVIRQASEAFYFAPDKGIRQNLLTLNINAIYYENPHCHLCPVCCRLRLCAR